MIKGSYGKAAGVNKICLLHDVNATWLTFLSMWHGSKWSISGLANRVVLFQLCSPQLPWESQGEETQAWWSVQFAAWPLNSCMRINLLAHTTCTLWTLRKPALPGLPAWRWFYAKMRISTSISNSTKTQDCSFQMSEESWPLMQDFKYLRTSTDDGKRGVKTGDLVWLMQFCRNSETLWQWVSLDEACGFLCLLTYRMTKS